MTRKYNDNSRYRNRSKHADSFSSIHPPGGFVAWPDGSTSRIGERRLGHTFVQGKFAERKGFVEWPISQAQLVRA